MSNVYGYIRVSSRDQNEDRQSIALQELHIPIGYRAAGAVLCGGKRAHQHL